MRTLSLVIFLYSLHCFALEVTPTVEVNQSLSFADDLDFANLNLAIERQMSSYDIRGLPGEISFGQKVYPKKVLKESLLLLKELAESTKQCQLTQSKEVCLDILNREINDKFMIYKPIPKKSEDGYKAELTT